MIKCHVIMLEAGNNRKVHAFHKFSNPPPDPMDDIKIGQGKRVAFRGQHSLLAFRHVDPILRLYQRQVFAIASQLQL